MNLIRKISGGDTSALEKLYEQHKTKVYRLALSLSGDPHLAEDITQDTFLRIQERAGAYRTDGSEAAWIMTIARNMTYDCLRRRSREVCGDMASEECGAPALCRLSSEADETDGAAGNLYFLDLLRDLSAEEKELVCLRILGGLSWSEIGRIANRSEEACRKRYERILKRLRAQLNDR